MSFLEQFHKKHKDLKDWKGSSFSRFRSFTPSRTHLYTNMPELEVIYHAAGCSSSGNRSKKAILSLFEDQNNKKFINVLLNLIREVNSLSSSIKVAPATLIINSSNYHQQGEEERTDIKEELANMIIKKYNFLQQAEQQQAEQQQAERIEQDHVASLRRIITGKDLLEGENLRNSEAERNLMKRSDHSADGDISHYILQVKDNNDLIMLLVLTYDPGNKHLTPQHRQKISAKISERWLKMQKNIGGKQHTQHHNL